MLPERQLDAGRLRFVTTTKQRVCGKIKKRPVKAAFTKEANLEGISQGRRCAMPFQLTPEHTEKRSLTTWKRIEVIEILRPLLFVLDISNSETK
jgi:hypothetical protein